MNPVNYAELHRNKMHPEFVIAFEMEGETLIAAVYRRAARRLVLLGIVAGRPGFVLQQTRSEAAIVELLQRLEQDPGRDRAVGG